MNNSLRSGKFFYALQAGAAGSYRFGSVGDNQDFGNLAAAVADHLGNSGLFGTGSAGVRDVFDIGSDINFAVAAKDSGANGKV